MRYLDLSLGLATLCTAGLILASAGGAPLAKRDSSAGTLPASVTEGSLIRVDPYSHHTGELCPLRHTDVRAEITGFLARVTVTQEFQNNTPDKIEAVYTFPLPRLSAVDGMTMKVGDRTIRAEIKKRDEARRIFEEARAQGHVASLLTQERPNIFTQSVTNIEPNAKVQVSITYVETLQYEEGAYEFSFPMTVGPRYNPASMDPADAASVTPKYAPPETRAGHDLSLSVKLDAGVPIDDLRSKTHEIAVNRISPHEASITLKQSAVIPNKDFILRYDVAGAKVQDAVLTHRAERGGFFTLILQPPERVTVEDVSPKELVFVLDTSGSMSGFPIEKAKETMRLAIAGLYPRDTFNLITFSGDTHILFPEPVPASAENVRRAQEFLAGRYGSGGTEMMKAVRAAFAGGEPGKVRIICFMTDGYVGNDNEIIAEVQKHSEARVFSFGIGSSVNRFLLDKMAEEGRGEVEYVGLNDDGSAAARRFHERVRNPLLTDISVDWNGLGVSDVYPKRLPDLFSAKPVIIHGRYGSPASGSITLRGKMSGHAYSKVIPVLLPALQKDHDVLATLWARSRIEDLATRNPQQPDEAEITKVGLEYRLMTQFTAFVAVEDQVVTRNGQPVHIQVPVEMPEGVSHTGVFGGRGDSAAQVNLMGRVAKSAVMENRALSVVDAAAPQPISPRHQEADYGKIEPALRQKETAALDKSQLIEVQIWLTEATPQALEHLKKLGFVESAAPKVAKIRTGRIRLDKLAELAAMPEVTLVAPAPAAR